ncbi:MAG: DUF58 domain-containing protein [Gemmataceae bacterium]|nr:DUF58 domain-containing protein [Gemmataceae bacterium]
MLTARGWWFLVAVGFILVLGVSLLPDYTVGPAVVGLPLLVWFAAEWVAFQTRLNSVLPRLRVTRLIVQGDREVPTVWAGLTFEVRVEVEQNSAAAFPFVLLEDRVPQAADRVSGDSGQVADLRPHDPARITYTLRCPAPGIVRFEGVRLRVADLNGFFYHRAFLREEAEFLVLPPLTGEEGRQRADKRFNTLPPPGAHRLRRPGSGGELLDLRDYRPGDPPKMIAWKASARRDTLITKEYESDVPVRCVLFLDTSDGVRLGPPGETPLVKLVGVAAGVAQAAAAGRDLVGLTTFDEAGANVTPPARTKLHMTGLLRKLAQAAALQPGTADVSAEALTARAYPLAVELYPELMNKRVNRVPWGRLWRPLLDRWWGWLVLGMMLLPATFLAAAYFLQRWYFVPYAEALAYGTMALTRWWGSGQIRVLIIPLPAKLVFFTFLLFLPALLGGFIWFVYGASGWLGERRRQLTKRKQLAAVFALHDGTGAAGVEHLIHDDPAHVARVGRFLAERQVRVPVPLYDDRGRYRFRSPGKAGVLAAALTAAVSRARDNELYVILADLAELGSALDPVVRAARVARARRHQVLVIVPWPADVPPPGEEPQAPNPDADPIEPLRRRVGLPRPGRNLVPLVQAALTRQYHAHFHRLRRALGQAGATVVRVEADDPVRLVLDRLDQVRGLRSRR